MKYLKLYEEFNSVKKIGLMKFPDIYIDGFITSMEDMGIKCETRYEFVYSDFTKDTIDTLTSSCNVLNTKDYKFVCEIIFERESFLNNDLSAIMDDVHHLSENFTDAKVFSQFNYNYEYVVYIVLDQIIPYSKWVAELKLEFENRLKETGIDMQKFTFNSVSYLFSINEELTTSERVLFKDATLDLHKKWNIGTRDGRGRNSIYVDLILELSN